MDCLGVSRQNVHGLFRVPSYVDAPCGDVLIHLAETNDRERANQASSQYETEASKTLQALLKKGYKKVIYVSSAVLYKDNDSIPRVEEDPVIALDTYTRVKLMAEQHVLSRNGLVVRLANVYGLQMASTNVLGHILAQLDRNGPVTLRDTTPVRDFIWVEDFAEAALKMVSGPAQGLLNIGTGLGTSIGELARIVLETASQTGRPIVSASSAKSFSCITLNITKAKQNLQWLPRTPLSEGLRHLLSDSKKLEHK